MILRARTIVTMNGAPIENGAVVIEAERVSDVGGFAEISAHHADEEILDLGEQALLPGLINPHCHLDYTCLRGKIPPQEHFADWIRAINAAKAKLAPSDYIKSIAVGFDEARKFGTTTIINFEAFPELIIRSRPLIRTWWMSELIDVRDPSLPQDLVDLALGFSKVAKQGGLAPHAPFTASLDLYRICQETARRHDLLLSTHLAESKEEFAMFRDAAGPLYDFMKEIGRDTRDCGLETPLAYLLRQIALDERWLVVHMNELSESDFDLLAGLPTRFQIVHCPRSHEYFGHTPFQFEKLRKLGFNICLGTDSLASNDDLSLFAEMRAFQREFGGISPERIFEMVTMNPARALQQENRMGKICRGTYVDLVAIPHSSGNVFEAIVGFDGEPWVMVDGKAAEGPGR